jgi:hypothetical protein
MRILAGLVVLLASLLSMGCTREGVMLQDAQQGEWSNFHDKANQISKDARPPAEKPAPEK